MPPFWPPKIREFWWTPGLSMRELRKRLASIGESLDAIDAILITHEHSDHVSGLPVLARQKSVRAVIYMTRLTAPAIDWGATPPARWSPFRPEPASGSAISKCRVSAFRTMPSTPWAYCFEAAGRARRRRHRPGLRARVHQVPSAAHQRAAARSQSRSGHAQSRPLPLEREAARDEPRGPPFQSAHVGLPDGGSGIPARPI